MRCPMCGSTSGEFDTVQSDYRITMPDGMQKEVCGRCYMLVKMNDNLESILEVLKDGRPRITGKEVDFRNVS